MIKKLFFSILIQSIGTLSYFALVWIITHYIGLEKQGEFAILKSWVDLWFTICCFGLPQGFIYAINKLNTPIYNLKKFSTYYPIVVIVVTSITSFFWFNFINKSISLTLLQYLFIGISIAGIVGHGLLRGIYITKNDGNLFALISILPALSLFLFTIISILINSNISFPEIYLLSGCISFIILFLLIKTPKQTQTSVILWKEIISHGESVFLQGLAITLLPVLTYWLMSNFDISQKEIGGFNIAMYFYLAIALPLNMVAPIFFNRWSKINDKNILKNELKKFIKLGIIMLLFSVIILFFIKDIIIFLFGKEILFAIPSIQAFILSGVLIYLNNIFSCMNMSIGKFKQNAKLFISKNIFTVLFVFIALKFFKYNLINITYSWILGDILLLCMMSFYISHYFRNNKRGSI